MPITIGGMDYGICLPNLRPGASSEGIDAAAGVAERLGWSTVWTTDHVLVPRDAADEYGHIYEALLTLAWVAARHTRIRLATSVIVVPQRNAVILAKELATLDSLSGGRVSAGVGIGWNRTEFANLGAADRFHVRGAYLDETILLWRHLWSGSTEPFRGRFHAFEDFAFGPLPVQAPLPIIVGGRAERALRRAGALGDGYHSSATGPAEYAGRLDIIVQNAGIYPWSLIENISTEEWDLVLGVNLRGTFLIARAALPHMKAKRYGRLDIIRAAADAAGRPMPTLSARVGVQFDVAQGPSYAMRGSPTEIAAEVRAFAALGVEHLALNLGTTDPTEVVAVAERFASDVAPQV